MATVSDKDSPKRANSQPSVPERTPSSTLPFERDVQEMEQKLAELEAMSDVDIAPEVDVLRLKLRARLAETYRDLSAWDLVTISRHPDRPVASDYIIHSVDEFHELFGDKLYGDDRAMMTGFARIGEQRFMLVAHRKGRTTKERLDCNFGCAHPEGYRKALRKMRLAEKLGLPIVTLINTPGAYPGIGAEERGQAAAIAENILHMFELTVPILTIVIGEGGSGGALGIGIGDRVLICEYAYYSVITPEGCAAILWKDAARTADAAKALKLTAKPLLELGLVDGVVPEPVGGAHKDREAMFKTLRETIASELAALTQRPRARLAAERREKFRHLGAIEGRFPLVGAPE
jgi:acetyl-CoA carboxylase carboxyl transferase subunit alpha